MNYIINKIICCIGFAIVCEVTSRDDVFFKHSSNQRLAFRPWVTLPTIMGNLPVIKLN